MSRRLFNAHLIRLQTWSIDVSVKTEENDVALSQASRSLFQLLIYLRFSFTASPDP